MVLCIVCGIANIAKYACSGSTGKYMATVCVYAACYTSRQPDLLANDPKSLSRNCLIRNWWSFGSFVCRLTREFDCWQCVYWTAIVKLAGVIAFAGMHKFGGCLDVSRITCTRILSNILCSGQAPLIVIAHLLLCTVYDLNSVTCGLLLFQFASLWLLVVPLYYVMSNSCCDQEELQLPCNICQFPLSEGCISIIIHKF